MGSDWLKELRETLRPPPPLTASQWADKNFYLSPESAAEPGRWTTLPYQREILDAFTDPSIEKITFMKSARVGATKMMGAAIGYFMDYDPCPIMVVQPTVEGATTYSKEEVAPMLRDCDVLSDLVETTTKSSSATILKKTFPGGSLSMIGANSGSGFRSVSRRVVMFDEVDGYPASAGNDGDQIKLGIRRTEYYWNRKIFAASTPLVKGSSRIETMFEAGDQRRYHVPCPHCGHSDTLVFSQGADKRGHHMKWPEGSPHEAHFVCSENGCVIEHSSKFAMLHAGKWIAKKPPSSHASFHIWAAYSMSPNATWGQMAEEFIEAKEAGPEVLKTFINTVLGETWKEKGEAPDHERLHNRREPYLIGSLPDGVVDITAGVDVQKDRLVFEVVGWRTNKESWSLDAGVLLGDTSAEEAWTQLDELLNRTFGGMSIGMMAVDSGYNTQRVYDWCRRKPMSRVIAIKGVTKKPSLVGVPSAVDINHNGKRLQRGYRIWPVCGDIAKAELYGWLRLKPNEAGEFPSGYCHFPEYAEEFFKQLTGEHLVTTRRKNGFTSMEWKMIPGRENHFLDCRVYARAAASVRGLDRSNDSGTKRPKSAVPKKEPATQKESFLSRSSPRRSKRKAGWLNKRR